MSRSLFLQHRRIALLLAVSLLASLTTVALAANIDINTNDGVLDIDWPAAAFVTDPLGDSAGPNVDIFAARVGVNHLAYPSPPDIAFRVDVNGQFPNTDGYFIRALLDCNRDGAMIGAGDVTVFVDPVDDWIMVQDGALHQDFYAAATDKAEVIVIVHPGWYVYEFKAPMGGGNVNWSQCELGSIDIGFDTFDGSAAIDTTVFRGFNVPTVVAVTEVKASPSRSEIPTPALAATVLLSGLVGLVVSRVLKGR